MHSLTIAWNMVRRTLGRKKGWVVYLVMPCIVVALAVLLLGQTKAVGIVVSYVNDDEGPAGQYVIRELARHDQYVLKEAASEAELRDGLLHNTSTVGIRIPSGLSQGLIEGEVPGVKLYELTASEGAASVRLTVESAIKRLHGTGSIIRTAGEEAGGMQMLEQVLGQVERYTIDTATTDLHLYSRPGLANVTGFTLMFMMGLISSVVTLIVDDRRQRTMSRIYTAPVRAYEIALGNFLGSLVVGSLQVMVVLLLSRTVLRYDYGISFGLHFLILTAFMTVSLGLATTVAGMIRNDKNTALINSLIITPTSMLGGCFWPISIMPDFMQKIANFIPQKWAIEAVEIGATGGSLADIGQPLAVLGLMAVILLAVGSAVLRPSEVGTGGRA
ncbi:ABC transporter permease subunit [Paenibacillus campinasensis]|uniref:ABC transporter permease subunit n=1 Tax=Paenibacillus campinasensis TaxID=66347 RepID=A0ABW9TAD4_9BACL|nr:ABC transporter permease [Paenibacillus campinasensis]MUG68121.1 ABC transporter permease subunit [Paenibacillus campinasensis]